jgi:putative ABC transport system permease protein
LVSKFSNVGVVDITQTIARLLQVVGQMMFAIQVTAWVSTLAGLGVLFSISRQQLRARLRDLSLMRLLGAGPSASSWLITTEFTLLGLLAGCSGLFLGLLGSYGLALALFDGSWSVGMGSAFGQAFAIVLVTVATGYFSSRGKLEGV